MTFWSSNIVTQWSTVQLNVMQNYFKMKIVFVFIPIVTSFKSPYSWNSNDLTRNLESSLPLWTSAYGMMQLQIRNMIPRQFV